MRTITIKPLSLRSADFINLRPADLGVRLRVLAYCYEQNNGGRIAGAADWKDREWLTACGVTLDEFRSSGMLVNQDGQDFEINRFPFVTEEEYEQRIPRCNKKESYGR